MHRSASWNHYVHVSSMEGNNNDNELPRYDPISDAVKKERSRVKFAENAVHVIPFVLLLCALTLWFFSHPVVDVGLRGGSVAARMGGLTKGDIHYDSDGTQSGFLPLTLDSTDNRHHPKRTKGFMKFQNQFK